MDKNTWKTLVKDEVKRILGDNYRVERLDQQEEGNIALCLGILKEGEISGIIVKADEPKEKNIESESVIREVAEYLTELYQEKRKHLHGVPLQDNEFSKWKDKVVYVLGRRDPAEKRLESLPHEDFLDMVITYGLIEKSVNPHYFRDITYADLKEWDITAQSLAELARKNTPVLWPVYLCICEHRTATELEIVDEVSVEEFLKREREKGPMYLLTNSENWNGAGCILYEDILKNISKKWEEDIVIIPISIHETALIPISKLDKSLDEWQHTVKEANQDGEGKEEVLSDSVYLYDRVENMIKIASSEAGQGRYFTS